MIHLRIILSRDGRDFLKFFFRQAAKNNGFKVFA